LTGSGRFANGLKLVDVDVRNRVLPSPPVESIPNDSLSLTLGNVPMVSILKSWIGKGEVRWK